MSGASLALVGSRTRAEVPHLHEFESCVTIGRSQARCAAVTFRIKTDVVSRVHAKISRSPSSSVSSSSVASARFLLEDKNSMNGTFLNGLRVSRAYLRHGDVITLGGSIQAKVGDRLPLEPEEPFVSYQFSIDAMQLASTSARRPASASKKRKAVEVGKSPLASTGDENVSPRRKQRACHRSAKRRGTLRGNEEVIGITGTSSTKSSSSTSSSKSRKRLSGSKRKNSVLHGAGLSAVEQGIGSLSLGISCASTPSQKSRQRAQTPAADIAAESGSSPLKQIPPLPREDLSPPQTSSPLQLSKYEENSNANLGSSPLSVRKLPPSKRGSLSSGKCSPSSKRGSLSSGKCSPSNERGSLSSGKRSPSRASRSPLSENRGANVLPAASSKSAPRRCVSPLTTSPLDILVLPRIGESNASATARAAPTNVMPASGASAAQPAPANANAMSASSHVRGDSFLKRRRVDSDPHIDASPQPRPVVDVGKLSRESGGNSALNPKDDEKMSKSSTVTDVSLRTSHAKDSNSKAPVRVTVGASADLAHCSPPRPLSQPIASSPQHHKATDEISRAHGLNTAAKVSQTSETNMDASRARKSPMSFRSRSRPRARGVLFPSACSSPAGFSISPPLPSPIRPRSQSSVDSTHTSKHPMLAPKPQKSSLDMLLEMFSPDQDSDSVSYAPPQLLRFSPVHDSQSHEGTPPRRRRNSRAASRRSASEPRSLPRSSPAKRHVSFNDDSSIAKASVDGRKDLRAQISMDAEIARGMMAVDQLEERTLAAAPVPEISHSAEPGAALGVGMSMPAAAAPFVGGRNGGFWGRGRGGSFRGRGRGGRRGRHDGQPPPACWLRMSAALQPLYRVPMRYRNFPREVLPTDPRQSKLPKDSLTFKVAMRMHAQTMAIDERYRAFMQQKALDMSAIEAELRRVSNLSSAGTSATTSAATTTSATLPDFSRHRRLWARFFEVSARQFVEFPDVMKTGCQFDDQLISEYLDRTDLASFQPISTPFESDTRAARSLLKSIPVQIHRTTRAVLGFHDVPFDRSQVTGLEHLDRLRMLEAVSRLFIDDVVLPLATLHGVQATLEETLKSRILPTSRFDYLLYEIPSGQPPSTSSTSAPTSSSSTPSANAPSAIHQNSVFLSAWRARAMQNARGFTVHAPHARLHAHFLGVIEAKRAGASLSQAFCQCVVQLLLLHATKCRRAPKSRQASALPLFGIVTDGFRYIFLLLTSSKIHSRQSSVLPLCGIVSDGFRYIFLLLTSRKIHVSGVYAARTVEDLSEIMTIIRHLLSRNFPHGIDSD